MEIDRETAREIAVSFGAVGVFVAVIVAIGAAYWNGETLGGRGGLALVGSIFLFVLVMTGVGLYLSRL